MTHPYLGSARYVGLADVDGEYLGTLPVSSVNAITPDKFVYSFLSPTSGPTGTSSAYDMNTNSASTDSVFEYEVPAGEVFEFARINLVMVDGSINPGDFAGIASGLTDGCLFEIIDDDGATQLLDFTGGLPLKTNADFAALAGTDIPITELAGDDQLPIRFSVFKAGKRLKMTAGQRIRWTNRDNLSAITKFRAMIQGIFQ